MVDSEKVKAIDLTMPGWGGWSGAGIDPSKIKKIPKKKYDKRRRKKLVILPKEVLNTEEDKEQMKRKDENLRHVIISEKKDKNVAAFQVNS